MVILGFGMYVFNHQFFATRELIAQDPKLSGIPEPVGAALREDGYYLPEDANSQTVNTRCGFVLLHTGALRLNELPSRDTGTRERPIDLMFIIGFSMYLLNQSQRTT